MSKVNADRYLLAMRWSVINSVTISWRDRHMFSCCILCNPRRRQSAYNVCTPCCGVGLYTTLGPCWTIIVGLCVRMRKHGSRSVTGAWTRWRLCTSRNSSDLHCCWPPASRVYTLSTCIAADTDNIARQWPSVCSSSSFSTSVNMFHVVQHYLIQLIVCRVTALS